MRVIAGEFGGRKLIAPEGLSTRPTTDKVRQAVFNSLGSMGVLDGATVADLYAGSGALGIEDRARVAGSDVLAYAPGITGVDIALIDPPYTFTHWPELLAVLRADLVVAESGTEVVAQPGWEQLKVRRHGRTVFTMLERLPE